MTENNANDIPEAVCPNCGRTSDEMEIYPGVQIVVIDCPCGWSAEIKQ